MTRHTSADLIRSTKWNDWMLHPSAIAELDRYLWSARPQTVVEFGSGVSTLVLARYAEQTGALVVSMEQTPRYLNETHRNLGRLHQFVKLQPLPITGDAQQITRRLPNRIDFALIDAPTAASGGRAVTLPALWPRLSPRFEVWLDDGERDEESNLAHQWSARFPLSTQQSTIPRGIIRFRADGFPMPSLDAHGVTITMLTGQRPALLERTLDALPRSLATTADEVIVLVNGAGPESCNLINKHLPEARMLTTPNLLPMGEAMGPLLRAVQSDLMIHIEDDWMYSTFDHGWLTDARQALRPGVAQVRLRHHGDLTRSDHMITGRPIGWSHHPYGLIGDAHLTTNPCLMRTKDHAPLFPAESERDMQRKAMKAGLGLSIQMHPGCFQHIGYRDSLRERTGMKT